MACKALTCSVSSAPLVSSSSSSSSSGVKALCFAPRSVSFPAKKISPLVIRAQNKEDSHVDVQVQRSSDQNQSTAVQRRPARKSALDVSPFGKSIISLLFIRVQILLILLHKKFQCEPSFDRSRKIQMQTALSLQAFV